MKNSLAATSLAAAFEHRFLLSTHLVIELALVGAVAEAADVDAGHVAGEGKKGETGEKGEKEKGKKKGLSLSVRTVIDFHFSCFPPLLLLLQKHTRAATVSLLREK